MLLSGVVRSGEVAALPAMKKPLASVRSPVRSSAGRALEPQVALASLLPLYCTMTVPLRSTLGGPKSSTNSAVSAPALSASTSLMSTRPTVVNVLKEPDGIAKMLVPMVPGAAARP